MRIWQMQFVRMWQGQNLSKWRTRSYSRILWHKYPLRRKIDLLKQQMCPMPSGRTWPMQFQLLIQKWRDMEKQEMRSQEMFESFVLLRINLREQKMCTWSLSKSSYRRSIISDQTKTSLPSQVLWRIRAVKNHYIYIIWKSGRIQFWEKVQAWFLLLLYL